MSTPASGASPSTTELSGVLPATIAAADFEVTLGIATEAGVLSEADYVADTAITGAATESRTLQIINKGLAGIGTTVMASKAFVNAVNAVAFDETALTLSATAADLVVAAGDVIVAKSLHVGSTGLADPGGTVRVKIARS